MEIKKVIAAVLSAAMLVGTGVCSFADSTVTKQTVSGIDGELITNQIQIVSNGGERIKSGYTLSVSDLNNSGVCAAKSSITFYVSSDNANWTATETTGDTYTITNDMANKQICAVLTDDSNVKYISNTVTVGENLKHVLAWDKSAVGATPDSKPENKVVFTDGTNKSKELLLLHSDADKSFFAAEPVSGLKIYDDSEKRQIFKTDDENSVLCKMNKTDFITANIMPESMSGIPAKHKLGNRGWKPEFRVRIIRICKTIPLSMQRRRR